MKKKSSSLEKERMIPGQVPSIQISVSSAGMCKSARVVWMPFVVDGEKEDLPQCSSAQLGGMNCALEGTTPIFPDHKAAQTKPPSPQQAAKSPK